MTTTESNQTPTPMRPCLLCKKPADTPDGMCTPCRAEIACANLCQGLTDTMEDFLDDRWAPHKFGDYYYDAPIFDG
jgi:hypothetical protein